jgi:hypothetical protein
MKEETTTEEAPRQVMLPGMEKVRTASDSDRLPDVRTGSDSDRLPPMEELAQENAQLKAELRMRNAAYDIETRLARAGARSPQLLAERAKESFQFSDAGELANAEAVVDHLRRTWPEQFAAPSIDASAGRTPRHTLTKEALARMTPAEIQRLDWNDVKATLAS